MVRDRRIRAESGPPQAQRTFECQEQLQKLKHSVPEPCWLCFIGPHPRGHHRPCPIHHPDSPQFLQIKCALALRVMGPLLRVSWRPGGDFYLYAYRQRVSIQDQLVPFSTRPWAAAPCIQHTPRFLCSDCLGHTIPLPEMS